MSEQAAKKQRRSSEEAAKKQRRSSEEAAKKQRSKCARGGGAVFAVYFIGLLIGTRSTRVPQLTLPSRECSADSLVGQPCLPYRRLPSRQAKQGWLAAV